MRVAQVLFASVVLLLAGCRAAPTNRAPEPQSDPVASIAEGSPTDSGPERLRYYDVKDLDTRNGILMVRGTTAQLGAIDNHLSGIRAILRDAETGETAIRPQPTSRPFDTRTVQIHAVADLVQDLDGAKGDADAQHTLRAAIRQGLGSDAWSDSVVRFQGESAIVVKAMPATQERVAAILDGLRGRAP